MSNSQLPDILLMLLIAMSQQSHASPVKNGVTRQVPAQLSQKIRTPTIISKSKPANRKVLLSLLSLAGLSNPEFGHELEKNEIQGLYFDAPSCDCIPVKQALIKNLPSMIKTSLAHTSILNRKSQKYSNLTWINLGDVSVLASMSYSNQGVQP